MRAEVARTLKGAGMAFRRFEFIGADEDRGTSSSAKFWEVSVAGSDLTVRFGRIGTDGQTKVKSLGSADAATKEAEKLIAEKTRKGYVEV
jgi:predicted DNA-binding WGR domain protein